MQASPVIEADRSMVLGKAVSRTAEAIGLTGKALAQIIGYSESKVSRILGGERGIDPATKAGEHGAVFSSSISLA